MNIESDETIILYLDILGYSNWVEKNNSYEKFNKILNETYARFEEFIGDSRGILAGFKDALKLIIISDSIILLLDIKEAKDKTALFVSAFLEYASIFIMKFISETGFLLRGGMSFGDVVIKEILNKKENIFIFSKAYIKSVKLEKVANFPRILIDETFMEKASEIFRGNSLEKGFLAKCLGINCLNYYYFVEAYFIFEQREELLKNIKNKIEENYSNGKGEFTEKIREKYYFFRDYHNNFIQSLFRAKLLDGDFNILKIEKENVVRPLENIGLMESNCDFNIKRDIEPDLMKIVRSLSCEDFEGKNIELAKIIKQRIEENNNRIKKTEINLEL